MTLVSSQRLRRPTALAYHFITDFAPSDAFAAATAQVLAEFAATHERVTIEAAGNAGGDFADTGATHAWQPSAWHRVGALKNRLMQATLDGGFDALWLVDADVLCDLSTLQSLVDTETPVVAAVYWTHWQKPVAGTQTVHAGPQVWLRHPYLLSGHGYSEAEFRAALISRSLLRVWGLGACTLFHRSALEKGVSFAPVPEGLPPGPMSDGEDRHLCERARRLHLPLFADAWADVWHCYHPEQIAELDTWVARLSAPHPETPAFGDLVSVRLDLLEPVPHPTRPNQLQQLGPQFARHRLGAGAFLPEIEEALAGMRVGDRRLLSLHFPAHYEYETLRAQQRLVSVTLLDAKPYRVPPTVDRELFVGRATGQWIDATAQPLASVEDLVSEAEAVHA